MYDSVRRLYDRFLSYIDGEKYLVKEMGERGITRTSMCIPTTMIGTYQRSSVFHNLQFKEFNPFDKETWPSTDNKKLFAICWIDKTLEAPADIINMDGIEHVTPDIITFRPNAWLERPIPFDGEDAELVKKFPFWLQLSQSRIKFFNEEPTEQNEFGPCYSLDIRSFNNSGTWVKFKIAFLTNINELEQK